MPKLKDPDNEPTELKVSVAQDVLFVSINSNNQITVDPKLVDKSYKVKINVKYKDRKMITYIHKHINLDIEFIPLIVINSPLNNTNST